MYDTILFPTDGSPETAAALDHAIDLALASEGTLHALFVVHSGFAVDGGIAGVLETLAAIGEDTVSEVRDRAEAAGVATVETHVANGIPHRAILDYAAEHGVDCIVMGTHGRSGIERYLLGSTTERVVRLSPVPVLTVRLSE